MSVRWDWHAVRVARKAMQDAPDLISRIHALFHYQGVLLRFVEKHWARLDEWSEKQP